MKPNQLLQAILFLILTARIVNAQTDPESYPSGTNQEESKWTYGAQLFYDNEFYRFDRNGERYLTNDQPALDLGGFLNYRLHDRHALQFETHYSFSDSYAIKTNLQYEFFITDRWSIYVGLGLKLDVRRDDQRFTQNRYKDFLSYGLAGVRFQANKWLAIDLRYERDLIKRYNSSIENYPILRNASSLKLGLQVRF